MKAINSILAMSLIFATACSTAPQNGGNNAGQEKLTEYVNILKAGESMQLRISFYPLTSAGNVFICKLFRHDNSIYANLSGESYTGERFNKSMYANVWNPIVWLTPPLQYGTADVTAGSASPYPEGTLYVVIE